MAPDPISRIRNLMFEVSGVNMNEGKDELVRARVGKRVRALSLPGLDAYVDLVESPDGVGELATMVDLLTTNKTSFFREQAHWEFLEHHVIEPAAERGDPLRFWSAGCSSGEEPYTLAMLLMETWPGGGVPDARVLATDLSRPVLELAQAGEYPTRALADVPTAMRRRWFRAVGEGKEERWSVDPQLRRMISFTRLNLMAPWPMRGPFDAILCRNVMIYFDRDTRAELVRRFAGLLRPGGFLLVGHSESLTGLEHGLGYVQPAVYRRGR